MTPRDRFYLKAIVTTVILYVATDAVMKLALNAYTKNENYEDD